MPLAAGARLGHYEIQGPLGSGGMGEVYRGRDTRLDRSVAIKMLTARVSSDPDRQPRFEREARAIASLNHRNICVLYDVGQHDGTPFIVMEYLEGETLAGRIARGPVPFDEAMTIAVQILDALEHAHRRGIVHRDLKPSNVMMTRDAAKLLDFGLAKIAETASAEDDEASPARDGPTQDASPETRTVPVAVEGPIVGSLNYMAPERLHGRDADARTDLFGFGAVLYEMVTGRRAFSGPSDAGVIAAILERQPEPIAAFAPRAPALLDRIVTKCLAKNPDERWQSATDLKQALEWSRSGVGGPGMPAPRPVSWIRRIGPAAALVAVSMALAIAGTLRFVPAPPDIASYRYSPLATESDYQGSAAWSPDGRTLAYVAQVNGVAQVFIRTPGSPTPVPVTRWPFSCRDPFWNENGTKIYFITRFEEGEGLFVVGVAGGDPELVLENVTAAALSPDGQTLAFLREASTTGSSVKTLWRQSPLSADPVREISFGDRTFGDGALAFSPDRRSLGIWGSLNDGVRDGPRTFWVLPVSGGPPREAIRNLPGGFPSFGWHPDSRHIVATISEPPNTHLWMFDTVTARAWPVTAGMTRESHPAVAPDGARVAMNSEQADFDLYEIFLDGASPAVLLATARQESDPAWASDNGYAFVTDRMGGPEIWMGRRMDAQGASIERPLVTAQDFDGPTQFLSSPAFAAGGQRFAFTRYGFTRYGEMMTVYVSTVGSSRHVPLLPEPAVSFAPTFSPDGVWVAFVGATEEAAWALQKFRVGSSERPVIVARDINTNTGPQWSPDGHWIAAETADGLTLLAAGGTSDPVVVSDESWFAYVWADARRLVGIRQSPSRRLMLSSIDIATQREVVLTPDLGPVPPTNYPIKGMTRATARSVVVGLARARSTIVLLDGLRAPNVWDRWRASPRLPWQPRP